MSTLAKYDFIFIRQVDGVTCTITIVSETPLEALQSFIDTDTDGRHFISMHYAGAVESETPKAPSTKDRHGLRIVK